jgi:hypothetical protein
MMYVRFEPPMGPRVVVVLIYLQAYNICHNYLWKHKAQRLLHGVKSRIVLNIDRISYRHGS